MNLVRAMDCNELVELVTDYLEGALPAAAVDALEQHLALCDGCRAYVDQMRATIALSGRLPAPAVPEAVLDELLAIFRTHRGGA